MNSFLDQALPRRLRSAGVVAAVVATIGAVSADPAVAGNVAVVEPEVGSSASLPGMPPGPATPPAAGTSAESQLVPAAVAPWARSSGAKRARRERLAALPQPASARAAPQSALDVVRWGFGNSLGGPSAGVATAGRPLYLWLTLDGGRAAVDRLRADGRLPIEVHWTREDAGSAAGAPALTTELTIGRPGLAPTFAEQVRKTGRFEWHSWARKDTLSRGRWTVSLTYPDGQPVPCGAPAAHPCRFAIEVGTPAG